RASWWGYPRCRSASRVRVRGSRAGSRARSPQTAPPSLRSAFPRDRAHAAASARSPRSERNPHRSASLGPVTLIGEDFFPSVDSGQMRLHARGPAGMRIEETEARFAEIEREIRRVIPARELEMLIDNVGIPTSWP